MAPPVARLAPYKDFLQPALQRRFAGTAAIVLGFTYVEAVTLSRWDSPIWPWMPLGLPGIRTFAIFICVLPIIILRIAHSHMGVRTSNSIIEILTNIRLFATLEAILTYIISAFLFSQVYLKSTSEEAGIRWISHATGRSRLNEHAVFFTTNMVVLGLVQGLISIVLDQDRLLLGTVKTQRQQNNGGQGNATNATTTGHWVTQISKRAPVLLMRCGVFAITVAMVDYLMLYHFLRVTAWRSSMWFLRFLYSDLPRYNLPIGSAPWSIWMLARSIWASFLLSLLWHIGDAAFRLQLSRAPLKNDQPLSAESKDPNGSLLNGLKSKKPRIFAFALWELALVVRDYTPRRESIFEDIDRKDGATWSQIFTICLNTIKNLERQIDEYAKSPAPAPEKQSQTALTETRDRISQPLRTDDVLASKPVPKMSIVRDTVSKAVTSPGKTPIENWSPTIKKRAVQVADLVMTQNQKEAIQPQVLHGQLKTLSLRVLALPVIGSIFQRTFNRQLARAVLGVPYAETSVYINAAYVLSRLAVCSLTEDKYGNVQRDVSVIIRTFTTVIKKLEAFRDGFPTHWTDISQDRQCPKVAEILVALKDGLNVLLEEFGQYSSDLRLSRADMRLAREAAQREEDGPEMQQTNQ